MRAVLAAAQRAVFEDAPRISPRPIPQEAVRVLIHHSADVNARDKNWQTPLHVAAANNALRCAEVIIPLLSSVNVSDRGGRTALHHAALKGHTEV